MTQRRWLAFALGLAVVGAVVWWRRSPENFAAGFAAERATQESPEKRATAASTPAARLTPAEREQRLRNSVEAHLADNLNLPGNTIQVDLGIVGSMLAAYRSISASRGNPIGDNREIVRALQGKNPNAVIFLPGTHRALNAQGELCDRWGTPFFFHAESGTKMEIRSAGPDKKLWTPDDTAIVP